MLHAQGPHGLARLPVGARRGGVVTESGAHTMTTRAENYGFPPDEIPLCMICLQPLETSEHQPVPWPGGSGLAHYECAAAEDEYAEWDDAGRPGGRR